MRTNRTRRTRLGAVILAGGLLFAACGEDDDDVATDDTTDVADSTPEGSPASPVSSEAGGRTFSVTGEDYAFRGLPPEINAGDKLTLTNASTKELHELVAVRLKDGESRSSAELAKLGEDEFAALAAEPGPPTAVLLRAPGGAPQIDAVGDGTLSKPGRYFIGCFIPTGADPAAYLAAGEQETDGPPAGFDGVPHVANGMHGIVVVK